MRWLLGIAILAGGSGEVYGAAPFPVDSFEIDVGQDYVGDVAVYENGSRAIVMFDDGAIRLRVLSASVMIPSGKDTGRCARLEAARARAGSPAAEGDLRRSGRQP